MRTSTPRPFSQQSAYQITIDSLDSTEEFLHFVRLIKTLTRSQVGNEFDEVDVMIIGPESITTLGKRPVQPVC